MHRVLTAEQTDQCPPHHWFIDRSGEGTCKKCPAVKQFRLGPPEINKEHTSRTLASLGGKKSGEARQKKGKGVKANANI